MKDRRSDSATPLGGIMQTSEAHKSVQSSQMGKVVKLTRLFKNVSSTSSVSVPKLQLMAGKDMNETDGPQYSFSQGQFQTQLAIDQKEVTEEYLLEQLVNLRVFCTGRKLVKQKETNQKENEERLNNWKQMVIGLSMQNVMDFLLNGMYPMQIIDDYLDACTLVFEEYLDNDEYEEGESALSLLFSFLHEFSMRIESQQWLLRSDSFFRLSYKYLRKVQYDQVFWEREILFLGVLTNILSCPEITDFTDLNFLRYAEMLITLYDYVRADHTEALSKQKRIKRKELANTPPLLFESGEEQTLLSLAVLPAYLAEFSPAAKLHLAQKQATLEVISKYENDQLQKQFTLLAILSRMCLDTLEKNEISKNLSHFIEGMKSLIQQSPSFIKRMVLQFFRLYIRTNDMRCWMKFSSPYIAIDSISTTRDILIEGQPQYIGGDIGIFSKWGAYFDEGDLLYLKDHIRFDQLSQIRSYTISLWFIYPFQTLNEYLSSQLDCRPEKPKKLFRTFLQCEQGVGCILGVLNESKFVFFDDSFQMNAFDMIGVNNGWNNIILKVDNQAQNVKLLLNLKEIANQFNTTLSRNIAFIGNSLDKNEPCGSICDLRFFESLIPDDLVERIVQYNRLQSMPDFLHFELEKYGICKLIDDIFEKMKDDQIVLDTIKCIISLSTNQYTKNILISLGVFSRLIPLTYHKDFMIRQLSQKALLFLQ